MTRKQIIDKFVWGPIEKVHNIGEYLIIEYHPEIFRKCCGTGKHHKHTEFHPYIKGVDTSRAYDTLDKALVGAIATKHEGCNSHAADYFTLMIGMNKKGTI